MVASVDQAPVLVFEPPASFISSNRISPSCLGEPILNSLAGKPVRLASYCSMRWAKSPERRDSICGSILIPSRSIAASTGGSGRSSVS